MIEHSALDYSILANWLKWDVVDFMCVKVNQAEEILIIKFLEYIEDECSTPFSLQEVIKVTVKNNVDASFLKDMVR